MISILSVLFFISGGCALVYQVMWLRMLALVFGVTVYAATAVLASFMAGLALGSFAAGRLVDRVKSPLRVFGLIEAGIGLSALATPFLLDAVKGAWVAVQPGLPSSMLLLTAARFVAAFLVLIVPTTLMGATLPVVMRSALVRNRAGGGRIGWLYAINTTGAIAGAVIAGFYLVSEAGVALTFRLAALSNAAIGLTAVVAAAFLKTAAGDRGPAEASLIATSTPISDRARRTVLWTFAASGLLSLALEIIWFRMLVVFLRPTAYAFATMLAAVLAGIAIGSAAAAPFLRRRGPWLAVLSVLQLAISLAAVMSFNTLVHLRDLAQRLEPLAAAVGADPYLAPIVAASLLSILPTTLLLGAAFPIGLSLWTGDHADAARRIGGFYSLNVCCAIAGSLIAGFALLPLLGSRGSLIAVSALAMLTSVALALNLWSAQPNVAGLVAIAAPVAFGMAALNAVNPFDVAARHLHRAERVLWRHEGVQTTVAVHERRQGNSSTRILYLDGMHQSDDLPGTAFVHHRLGALPVMLHEAPRRALVIGLGAGATSGGAAVFPGIQVDVVELSHSVAEAARYFEHVNFGVLKRPNVSLRIEDGRHFLLTTKKRYDIVTADIILPRHAGAGALYAKEYFELVRGALDDNGLALQWNGAEYETPYKMILRTFMSVFPHTTLWGDGSLLVGSRKPFVLSRSAYEARRNDSRFREVFDWDLNALQANYIAGPADLARWVGEGPTITDDRPVIEYFLSLPKDDPLVDLRPLKGNFADVLRP